MPLFVCNRYPLVQETASNRQFTIDSGYQANYCRVLKCFLTDAKLSALDFYVDIVVSAKWNMFTVWSFPRGPGKQGRARAS